VSSAFRAGETCLIVDGRGRHYLTELDPAGAFQYHVGVLSHSAIIGAPEGSVLRSSGGGRLVVLRPRLADYILRMRRGAQIVYPKDVGPIIHWGDIGPGMSVLEAGTGSGALTMALLRAVGPEGTVVSVEERPDHAAGARQAIERFFGGMPPNLDLRIGLVEEQVALVGPDRLVLDLPQPWEVVAPAVAGLTDGGVFISYLPTVPQVQHLQDELRFSRRFIEVSTFEVLQRDWVVEGRSVRPDSQMVGHTGFITVARKTLPIPEERPAESDGPRL
jgi:tRNA (adenine57-N1/adenine58-N1)-methyltransferase